MVCAIGEAPVRRTPPPPHRQRDGLYLTLARGEGDNTLTAERLLELRGRVLDGRYDSPAVLDSIALAILKSRDLG